MIITDDDSAAKAAPDSHADLLVSLGDIADGTILDLAKRCACREIFAVKGNHDSSGPFPSPIKDAHLKIMSFQGFRFGGFCGSWKYKPRGHFLFEQAEIERSLGEFPPVDVFLSHNSPRFVHDREDEVHLGFTAFGTYLARAKPRWLLHGHQHVNQETRIGPTRVVGTFGYRFLVIPD